LIQDCYLHGKWEFGLYVQTHENHNNSIAPRTMGSFALRPTKVATIIIV